MTTKTMKAIADELSKPRVLECSICLFTSDIAKIHDDGVCEYCKLQDTLRANANPDHWPGVLAKIKKAGNGKQYDCLIGISGGEDSSILLYLAVKEWGLRPLVIHFDNRFNRKEANDNIALLSEKMNVNFTRYYLDQTEYNTLTDSFIAAGVQDADIPNDIAMAKLMYSAARQNGIKYILNGHDFRREGSSPAAWSYMDAKYVQSVYRSFTSKELKNYPLYTFWDQIVSGFLGIKQVRPYHYSDFSRGTILSKLKEMGWQDYGGKHNENIYTAFVGNFLLPHKFKIDKRRTYLSAQIREGFIDKEYAKEILTKRPEFNLDDLGERKDMVMYLAERSRIQPRTNFARYNFKRWKVVIWLLAKLKIVPWTMFAKYCR